MANIVLIEDDLRVISTLASLIQELGDDHRLKVFRSEKEFSDLYFNPNKQGLQESTEAASATDSTAAPIGEDQTNEDQSLQLLSTIDLLILKWSLSPPKSKAGLDGFYTNLKRFRYFPQNGRTKLMITKYEDDGVEKFEFLKPYIDDLMYLPIDRLVFLQKAEILLALPKLASPSFLFSQETDLSVEIAKLAELRMVSDWGCAISNPVPLIPGLLAHFYIDLPGTEAPLEIYAKVIYSEKKETDENFLVYFSFLNLDRSVVLALRRIISQRQSHFELFKNSKREDCSFNPDHLFLLDDERRPRNIVVIDPNPETLHQLTELIRREMDLVQISSFSSYSQFLKQYFDLKTKTPAIEEVLLPNQDELLGEDFSIEFHLHSLELLHIPESQIAEENPKTLLGFDVGQWTSGSTEWLALFGNGVNRENFDESVQETKRTQKTLSKIYLLKTNDGALAALQIRLEPGSENCKLTFHAIDQKNLEDHLSQQKKLPSIDLVIASSLFVSKDVTSWISGLENQSKKHGLLKEEESLPIIVISSDEDKRSPHDYSDPRVRGLIKQPIEAKPLMTLVSLITKNPYTLYHFFNMNWIEHQLRVQVAREAKMVRLSEYGVTLRHPRPIRPGTFLFLRREIFDQAPRKNLCARFYSCTEDATEKGQYLCHLTYFGINDSFLRFARSWFREAYAQSKGPGF